MILNQTTQQRRELFIHPKKVITNISLSYTHSIANETDLFPRNEKKNSSADVQYCGKK